ncbi:MAG TPA: peptidoglycan DD-metalloendopeptidase family protein, partial [bacterium]|nr:peptidoglycan DD-metalloendopeptidase family protein [bacterium]
PQQPQQQQPPKKNDNISELELKLKKLKEETQKKDKAKELNLAEIMRLANQIEFEKDREKNITSELNTLDRKIAEKNKLIKELEIELEELNKTLNILMQNIDDLEKRLASQKSNLAKRIRTMYKEYKKNSELYILLHLLESDNIAEFRKRLKFSNVIVANDRRIIDQIMFSINELSLKKKEQERLKDQQTKMIEEQETQKREFLKMRKDRENMLSIILKNQKTYNQEIELRRRQMRVIEAAINSLLLEQKQTAELIELAKLDFKNRKGKLSWPLKMTKENKILAYFEDKDKKYKYELKNDGIEIKCRENQEVYSVAEGIVLFAGWIDSFGYTIIISHGAGYITLYAHLNSIEIKVNDKVKPGALIGRAGDTGSLVGTSLFFQIRENKIPVDPLLWLSKN